jgi:hypothetical protein
VPKLHNQPAARPAPVSTLAETDPEVQKLAQQLSTIHGTVRIARESSGLHFYIASPYCLEHFGEEELYKLHLAVNVEKYLSGAGDYVAMCMKSGEVYSIQDLLFMPTVSQRGYDFTAQVVVKKERDMSHLEQDANGNWLPKSPGEVTPILELPSDHPAMVYLRHRNFDPMLLSAQFELAYCEKERSDCYYRRLLNGFRATPQGRIVFYIRQGGLVRGWQARILEIEHEGKIHYWHPYKRRWVAVLRSTDGKPEPLEGWDDWDPAKYVIAQGCPKSEILMGYDAALQFDYRSAGLPRFCVLTEGALDAGRVGSPGMAMLGKHLSDDQAELLRTAHFDPIIYVKDRDAAGTKAAESTLRQLQKLGIDSRLKIIEPPGSYKDLGEVPTHEEAKQYIYGFL